MSKSNIFPSEFLQKVSTHLSFKDWYQCSLVCRFWYHSFQRAIYKKVYIYSDNHFQVLINSLSNSHTGLLIKELHLLQSASHETSAYIDDAITTVKNNSVVITQQHFELINTLCPYLEYIDFDISQWEHIDLEKTTAVWNHLRGCAPIEFNQFDTTFLSVFGISMTTLHINHYPEQLDSIIDKLPLLPSLQDLTLEMMFDDEGDNEDISVLTSYLEKINTTCPQLLKMHLKKDKTPHHEVLIYDQHILTPFSTPSKLESLSLHGHVDSIQWFEFIAQSYPYLKELNLTQLSTSRFGTKWMWQQALIQMMQSLPQLTTLTLGGRNVPQLFSKAFALELKKPTCPIKNLYIDFKTFQAIESCQFLLVVASHGIRQLKCLKLRVWEQIPGWSGVTFNLFQCKSLVSLELSLSKGLMDQFPFTPFLIDHFLQNLPQLEKLVLTGANVQVTYKHYIDLTLDQKFALQTLELYQSKLENHVVVFQYLSTCCPNLKQTVFRKCETEKPRYNTITTTPSLNTCDVDFTYSDLDKIVLSSLMIYIGTLRHNEFIGIRLKCDDMDKTIWCSAIKTVGSYTYPHYVVCEDKEKYTELDEVYQSYTSTQQRLTGAMPGKYSPTIGFFTICCKSVNQVYLDNLKLIKSIY